MKLPKLIALLVQILLSVVVMLLSVWTAIPWWSIAGMAVLFAALIAVEVISMKCPDFGIWGVVTAFAGTIVGLGYLLFGRHFWDDFYTVWAGLVAVAVFSAALRLNPGASKNRLRMLGILWALSADFVWLIFTYQRNDRLGFYVGLLLALSLLVLSKSWFRMTAVAVLGINTVITFIIGLPAANLIVSPADSLSTPPALADRPFSYEFFKKDPAGYQRWRNYFEKHTAQFYKSIFIVEPGSHPQQFRLRPNSKAVYCECPVSINSKGFRGPEISDEKGNAYRIVTLGESSTFGITIYADEQPWPELLERLIKEQLKPKRPVEVINAGIPSYSITDNLYRLPSQILPLKPDLIISYHGYNGFQLINKALPPRRALKPHPIYKRRPLKIRSDIEYVLKMSLYVKHLSPKATLDAPRPGDPMDSEYAAAYRDLIQISRTNGIRLVLSTYSMAVNKQSNHDVFEFYHMQNPLLHWEVQANIVHTTIVRNLAEENADIILVDTQPELDGVHEKFMEAVHFSPEGEQQMAETFFSGIRKTLEEDLPRTNEKKPSADQSDRPL